MSETPEDKPKFSEHFFRREPNGMVKLRFNLKPEEASLIEEAAGDRPIMLYVHKALVAQARADVRAARKGRIAPPPK